MGCFLFSNPEMSHRACRASAPLSPRLVTFSNPERSRRVITKDFCSAAAEFTEVQPSDVRTLSCYTELVEVLSKGGPIKNKKSRSLQHTVSFDLLGLSPKPSLFIPSLWYECLLLLACLLIIHFLKIDTLNWH
ncbi:hypothetical protein SAMN04487910_0396 [Aquimarina amphilecti]|uniref:Uncharacterized protein n=1 Tax=Aquimarina amphilecti TaxID=1038014 RepID=A0A1H7GJE5_AQUAM|nr:hypothetical protein SAMN04487910_0396 [Aquimarina amphilecti]